MDGEHITNTDFRYGSAERLVDYIGRDEHTVENRAGQEMTDEERERFIDRSEHHEFERQIMISPHPEKRDMTEQEMKEATRDSVNSYFSDAETVDFCYSYHEDEQHGQHVHVALAGEKDELYMNQSHIRDFNEQSHELFLEHENDLEQEIQQENDLEQELEQDRGHALG